MDAEGFGNCTNQYECQAVCPKEISVAFIAKMNREYLTANVSFKQESSSLLKKPQMQGATK